MFGGTFSFQTSNEQQSLTLLAKACATVLPYLGLSISPADPPNPPVPDSLQPDPTAPVVEHES